MKLELTDFEARTLTKHLGRDISYGCEGTFGSGRGVIDEPKEYAAAKRVLKKLRILTELPDPESVFRDAKSVEISQL